MANTLRSFFSPPPKRPSPTEVNRVGASVLSLLVIRVLEAAARRTGVEAVHRDRPRRTSALLRERVGGAIDFLAIFTPLQLNYE